jgi:hypothetical protein
MCTTTPPVSTSLGTKVKLALWWLSAFAGVAMAVGSPTPPLRAAGFGLIAISPIGIIALLIALIIALSPVIIVLAIVNHRSYKKSLREVDRLEAAEGSERELDEAFARLENHVGSCSSRKLEMGRRLLDERHPGRRRYLRVADAKSIEAVARRSDDPLAPFAWHRALELQYGDLMREDVSEEEIIRLWAKSLEKDESLILPQELVKTGLRLPDQA